MGYLTHTCVRRMTVLFVILGCLFGSTYLLFSTIATAQNVARSFQYPVKPASDYDFVGARQGYTFLKWSTEGGVYHPGIDVNLVIGKSDDDKYKPVYTIGNGVVRYAQNTGGSYGNLIIIEHTLLDGNSICSVYGHLNQIFVSQGQSVSIDSSDPIGTIGDSGTGSPHLHWEIRTVCGNERTWPTGLSPEQVSERYVDPYRFVNDFNYYTSTGLGYVSLFTDSFFRGGALGYLHAGSYNLESSGFSNIVSSVGMGGLTATAYEQNTLTGDWISLYESDTNLANNGFTDGVSSKGSADNAISSLTIYAGECSSQLSAASAQAATLGSSCNPNPAPAPGSQPLPPYTGTDTTPPRISAFNVSVSKAQAFLSVSASDLGGAGINDISYSAKVNGTWRGIATVTQSPFSFTWNLCDAGVPDGDIEFGAVAHDRAGNYYNWSEHSPNLHRTKSHNCSSGGGSNPTPQRSCTNLGDWDKSFAYFFDSEGCLGNISWFSAHPADGPGKSGQQSAYVPTGAILKISSDNWNQGEKGCLTGSTQSLASIGWANKIEWAELVYGGTCAIEQPSRGVTFFSEKNYAGSSWKKTVGFSGGMTDNFNSVRMDDGEMSFVLTNRYGESTCFDKYRFDNLSLQHHSMIDHGDWWDNTVWVFVDNKPCRPLPPYITGGVQWKGEYPYGTNLTITYRPQRGSGTTLGELTSSSGDKLYLSAPETQTSWSTGTLNPGWYAGYLYSMSDHGLSDRIYMEFIIKDPTCLLSGDSVILFDGTTCTGESVTLTEAGWYTLQQFDNKTSSLYIPPDKSLEVFDGTHSSDGYATCFEGSKWDLTKDFYYPDSQAADNSISTVRLWDGTSCGRQTPRAVCPDINLDSVVLYDYAYCLGEDRIFTTAGFYNLSDFDNRASAIYIPPGKSLRVYSENTKQGDYVCFEGAKWKLSQDRFWHTLQTTGNAITSIEVFDTPRCGWPQQLQIYDAEQQIFDTSTFLLTWEDAKAEVYWVELWGPSGFFLSSGELTEPRWELSNLPAGQYVWRMRAAVLGTLNEVSEDHYFTVLPSGETLPFTATYVISTTSPLSVDFIALHCVGEVTVTFGDGAFATQPCTNGVATVQHAYAQAGTYAAFVQDIALSVLLPSAQLSCPEKSPAAGVRLFADAQCGGDVRTFASPGAYELSDFNDQTSAILLAPGWSVEVFEHSNSSDGHAFCVTSDVEDLSFESYYDAPEVSLEGTVSNLWLHANSTCGKTFPQYGGCGENIPLTQGVVLFDYLHCGGEEHHFTTTEKKDLSWGTSIDNKASSVRVANGWSIKLFVDRGWMGESVCIAEDTWRLPVTFSNTVSGVEVFHDSVCGRQPPPVITQLAAPTQLAPARTSITPTQTLTLTWQPVQGSAGYKLEFTASPQHIPTTLVNQTSYLITVPVMGVYTWRVKALPPFAATNTSESEWATESFVLIEKQPDTLPPDAFTHYVFLPAISR